MFLKPQSNQGLIFVSLTVEYNYHCPEHENCFNFKKNKSFIGFFLLYHFVYYFTLLGSLIVPEEESNMSGTYFVKRIDVELKL